MLFMADATIMYTDIQNFCALNQIAQYSNDNKTKYRHLLVNAMLRALFLIMKNNTFRFGDSHWQWFKSTATGTPTTPTYDTVFYSVFELLLLEIFGNNFLLYRRFIDNILDLWKRYDEECDAAQLRYFQETMQEQYGL